MEGSSKDKAVSSNTTVSTGLAVSELKDTCSKVVVHGVITKLSPMKQSSSTKRKYFDGLVTDDQGSKRFVSFNTTLFDKMKKAQQDTSAVGVFNCDVKRSALSTEELEIVLNHKSDIVSSPKKFKVDSTSQSNVSLSQLPVLAVNQLVSTHIKVTKVQEPVQVTSKTKLLTKQDCTISDATGIALIVLWESKVGTLKEGISYNLSDIRVKQFNDNKYFSATVDTTISTTDDIGEVVSESLPLNPYSVNIVEGDVVSVICEEYYNCQLCHSKMQLINDFILQCPKCKIKSKISGCKKAVIAKVHLKVDTEFKRVTLFQNVLQQLVDTALDKDSIEEKLLMIDSLKLEVDANNIAKGIME